MILKWLLTMTKVVCESRWWNTAGALVQDPAGGHLVSHPGHTAEGVTMTKVVCESMWGNTAGTLFEIQLVATLFATMTLLDILATLSWIQVTHWAALD